MNADPGLNIYLAQDRLDIPSLFNVLHRVFNDPSGNELENFVEKGENAVNQQSLLFVQSFPSI